MIRSKNQKIGTTAKSNDAALPDGVKVVPAPKSAAQRALLSEADITTSGGLHSFHNRKLAAFAGVSGGQSPPAAPQPGERIVFLEHRSLIGRELIVKSCGLPTLGGVYDIITDPPESSNVLISYRMYRLPKAPFKAQFAEFLRLMAGNPNWGVSRYERGDQNVTLQGSRVGEVIPPNKENHGHWQATIDGKVSAEINTVRRIEALPLLAEKLESTEDEE